MRVVSKTMFCTVAILIGTPLCAKAGFLMSRGVYTGNPQNDGSGYVKLSAPLPAIREDFYFSDPSPSGYQLDEIQTIGPNQDGEVEALGGLYAVVNPSIAYIAITDGSLLSLTPPEQNVPGNPTWNSSLEFSGYLDVFYFPTPPFPSPTRLNVAVQYSVSGYLAPEQLSIFRLMAERGQILVIAGIQYRTKTRFISNTPHLDTSPYLNRKLSPFIGMIICITLWEVIPWISARV